MKIDLANSGTICVKCQKDKIAQKDAEIERLNNHIASLMETFTNLAIKLGIDFDAAENAPGKPSDIFFAYYEKQSAMLKLAKAAITEAKGWNWLDDDMPHVVQRRVDEALAAINEVLGDRE